MIPNDEVMQLIREEEEAYAAKTRPVHGDLDADDELAVDGQKILEEIKNVLAPYQEKWSIEVDNKSFRNDLYWDAFAVELSLTRDNRKSKTAFTEF